MSKAGGCAHQAMCPQGEVENNIGRKRNKSHRRKGIQEGTATPQRTRRPSPEQSTSFSSEPNRRRGLFPEPWLSGEAETVRGNRTSPGQDRDGTARGLQPGVSVAARMRPTRSQQSDQRRGARKAIGGGGTSAVPGGCLYGPLGKSREVLPSSPCHLSLREADRSPKPKDRRLKSTFTCFGNPLPLLCG